MYLAQANYSLWHVDAGHELITQFKSLVPDIYLLAEQSDGFIWRYVEQPDNSDVYAVFHDPRVIFNMSVWSGLQALKSFAFQTDHKQVMARRATWFDRPVERNSVLWWIDENHRPNLLEAKEKLDLLNQIGPSEQAFTFAQTFAAT